MRGGRGWSVLRVLVEIAIVSTRSHIKGAPVLTRSSSSEMTMPRYTTEFVLHVSVEHSWADGILHTLETKMCVYACTVAHQNINFATNAERSRVARAIV